MAKHQKWGRFAANNDVLQNRMDTCAFRMHALSPTKEQPDFSRGLLTEHRRLVLDEKKKHKTSAKIGSTA